MQLQNQKHAQTMHNRMQKKKHLKNKLRTKQHETHKYQGLILDASNKYDYTNIYSICIREKNKPINHTYQIDHSHHHKMIICL